MDLFNNGANSAIAVARQHMEKMEQKRLNMLKDMQQQQKDMLNMQNQQKQIQLLSDNLEEYKKLNETLLKMLDDSKKSERNSNLIAIISIVVSAIISISIAIFK